MKYSVAYYASVEQTREAMRIVDLKRVLTTDHFRLQVETIRRLHQSGATDEARRLKRLLPCFTPSGIFTQRRKEACESYTGLVQLDFDQIAHRNRLWHYLMEAPWVWFAGESVRGNLFALARVAGGVEQHGASAERLFEVVEMDLGEPCDRAMKASNALRYVSYSPRYYLNEAATAYRPHRTVCSPRSVRCAPSGGEAWVGETPQRLVERILATCEARGVDIAPSEPEWWAMGCALLGVLGDEAGLDCFKRFSRMHRDRGRDCDAKWRSICRAGRTLSVGVIANLAKNYRGN